MGKNHYAIESDVEQESSHFFIILLYTLTTIRQEKERTIKTHLNSEVGNEELAYRLMDSELCDQSGGRALRQKMGNPVFGLNGYAKKGLKGSMEMVEVV